MTPFEPVTGTAAPLLLDDINTDQIAPAYAPPGVKYGDLLFPQWRKDPHFVLNDASYRGAQMLVTGNNFGSGSTRESAVWALMQAGFRVIVARSFGEIFRENCLRNGVLPVTLALAQATEFEKAVIASAGKDSGRVDLESQTLVWPHLGTLPFHIAPAERNALLKGLDDVELTLEHADAIKRWEIEARKSQPWLQTVGTL